MNRRDLWSGMFTAAGLLGVYFSTISSTVGWTDNGELIAVAYTLGIAHPTGYPLMTTLSRGVLSLPLPGSVLTQLNVLVALLTALSCGVLSIVIRRFIGGAGSGRKKNIRSDNVDHVIAIFAASMLGLSSTVWLQSSSYEVYALHFLLISVILFALDRSMTLSIGREQAALQWWSLTALLLGFGFSNHMTTILLVPAIIIGFLRTEGRRGLLLRKTLLILPFFLTGISWYFVLYVRAHAEIPLNWGDPDSMENLFRHVSGQQYRIWMFSGSEVIGKQLKVFVENLPAEFLWPFFAIMIAGSIGAWWMARNVFWIILASFVFTVAYAVNYDIHEIGPYFLLAYVAMAIAAAFGLQMLADRFTSRKKMFIIALMCGLVVIQGSVNWGRIKRDNTGIVDWFSRTVLTSVELEATIFTSRWDFLYSPSLELQYVEGLRPDVRLIDYNLLRDRSWYVEHVRRTLFADDPSLQRSSESFLVELRKFERGEPFIPRVIQARWQEFVGGVVNSSFAKGPVYVDARLGAEFRANFWLIPEGFLVRMSQSPGSYFQKLPPKLPENLGVVTDYLKDFKDYCATSYAQHAWQLRNNDMDSSAYVLARLGSDLSPSNPLIGSFFR